jgi:predicted TIM-barrel fold metal-dependent hydrolase
MRIVDPHHHLWDLSRNDYPWLNEPAHDRGWGDWSALKRSYLPADLLADAAAGGLTLLKTVHVQANYDPADPVGETRWLEEVAGEPGSAGLPHGIVAFADLSADDAEEVLAAHAAFPRVRGVRQVLNRHPDPRLNRAPRDFLADPAWRRGLSLLSRWSLSFDLQIYQHQAAAAAEAIRAHPDTAFILDHALMPAERTPEALEGWRRGIALLAREPNLVVKLSGFGMVDTGWTETSIRPFVRWCIECFGAERCMFASNFPVDRLMADYGRLWRAFDSITGDLSQTERDALFRGTAERVYRI